MLINFCIVVVSEGESFCPKIPLLESILLCAFFLSSIGTRVPRHSAGGTCVRMSSEAHTETMWMHPKPHALKLILMLNEKVMQCMFSAGHLWSIREQARR